MTYKAVGSLIINYAAPVWSTNLRDTNYRNIQYTRNEALRIATGCHKMSSVDQLHSIWLDVFNQEMSATPSPQEKPQRDG